MPVQGFVGQADGFVLEGTDSLGTPVSTGTYKGVVHLPVAVAVGRNHVEVGEQLYSVASLFFGNVRGAALGKPLVVVLELANADYRTYGVVVPVTIEFEFLLLQQLKRNALQGLHALVVLQGVGVGLGAAEVHHFCPVVGFFAFKFEEFCGGLYQTQGQVDLALRYAKEVARISAHLHGHVTPGNDGLPLLKILKSIP